MTTEQQADYLIEKGWRPASGDLWYDKLTVYLWEQSAAVRQQKFRDRERTKMEAKTNDRRVSEV